jgi:hypothetical protein
MLKGRKAKQPSNNMLKKIRRAMACRNTEIAQLWYFQHSFTPEHSEGGYGYRGGRALMTVLFNLT